MRFEKESACFDIPIEENKEEETKVLKEHVSVKKEEVKEYALITDDDYDIAVIEEHPADVEFISSMKKFTNRTFQHLQMKPPNDSLQKPTVANPQGIRSEDDRFNKFVSCRTALRTALNDEKNIEIYIGE